jgi:hypothetical protein
MRRRVEFLRARPYDNTWDKSEIAALEWAIEKLTPLCMPIAHVVKEPKP